MAHQLIFKKQKYTFRHIHGCSLGLFNQQIVVETNS
jgi:hypothetical protein